MKKFKSIFCIIFFAVHAQADQTQNFLFANRSSWRQACAQLPMNIDVTRQNAFQCAFAEHPEIGKDKQKAYQEFSAALMSVKNLQQKKLSDASLWTDAKKPTDAFYDNHQNVFVPYSEKLTLQPGQKVVFHGDLHGDIHSLQAELDQLEQQKILKTGSFELADKNAHLAFLGDYVDRGHYGVEVLYTLFRLKLANPNNVLLIRGNHEDQQISDRYGFKDELKAKFGSDEKKYHEIYRLYNYLPVVAYVGHKNDYLQCCHGGLEHGYQPQKLLESSAQYDQIGTLQRGKLAHFLHGHTDHRHACCNDHGDDAWYKHPAAFNKVTLSQPIDQHGSLGFMWADFLKSGFSKFMQGRGLATNEDLAKAILDFLNEGSTKKIRGVFRAHQHAGVADQQDPANLMYELIASNGVYCMWKPIQAGQERSLQDGMIWTFNVAPDGPGNKNLRYGFDAYAVLMIAEKYKDWKLSVHNPMIINRTSYSSPK